jgi:hypothetical protein
VPSRAWVRAWSHGAGIRISTSPQTLSFLRELPSAVDEAAELHLEAPFTNEWPRHWGRLAVRLHLMLSGHGFRFHAHEPSAEHLRGPVRGGARYGRPRELLRRSEPAEARRVLGRH